jgi:RNA polymerase sigma-70 factor (ECF subfamily)
VSEDLDSATTTFLAVRPRLFGIAYRMLGSAAEAEDVVQDAWLRWQSTDRSEVQNPGAFLATTTTRLAINLSQSARKRRESYVGPWLPEPVDTSADPALGAERAEALDLAVLVLLESLAPRERAAFVLREAFDYAYPDIAQVLEVGEANARQLVSRARKRVTQGRRAPASATEHRRLLEAFVGAAREGDVEALEQLFADDVVSTTDGGGLVRRAARVPVVGRVRVARFHDAWGPSFWPGTEVEWVQANGRPAAVVVRDGKVLALVSLATSATGIDQTLWLMNPEKLGSVRRGPAGPA